MEHRDQGPKPHGLSGGVSPALSGQLLRGPSWARRALWHVARQARPRPPAAPRPPHAAPSPHLPAKPPPPRGPEPPPQSQGRAASYAAGRRPGPGGPSEAAPRPGRRAERGGTRPCGAGRAREAAACFPPDAAAEQAGARPPSPPPGPGPPPAASPRAAVPGPLAASPSASQGPAAAETQAQTGRAAREAAAVYFQGPCLRHTRVCTRPRTRRCARLAAASPTRPISARGSAVQSGPPARRAAAPDAALGAGLLPGVRGPSRRALRAAFPPRGWAPVGPLRVPARRPSWRRRPGAPGAAFCARGVRRPPPGVGLSAAGAGRYRGHSAGGNRAAGPASQPLPDKRPAPGERARGRHRRPNTACHPGSA